MLCCNVDTSPSKVILLYATMGKLRLFGSERTVEAAEKAMNMVVQTYYAPKFDLRPDRPSIKISDILRDFTKRCRAELR